MTTPDDERWMRMALQEACQGVGKTAPDPPVGALKRLPMISIRRLGFACLGSSGPPTQTIAIARSEPAQR